VHPKEERMMTFTELLQKNKDAIIQRWLEKVFTTYSGEASAALLGEKDPFANPVGMSLRKGTRGIFEALLDGMNVEKIRRYLNEILKIRAVQEFSASQAVSFLFLLKEALQEELGQAAKDSRFSSELTELDGQIDRIALDAFDIYVRYREQVYELRVNEVKRRGLWVVDKINKRDLEPKVGPDQSEEETSKEREDLR